jgi:hypothetical protein
VPPRTTFRTGCPGATRTRDPRCRRAVLCSAELRDKNIDHGLARRSFSEGWWYAQEESNLQPRSSPELTTGIGRPLCQLSYGRNEMVRVVGFEPTVSCVRGRHSCRAELHPVGAP